MQLKKIYQNLCYYDKRNPNNDLENGNEKENCYCDNCFYGRNILALEILRLNDIITVNIK